MARALMSTVLVAVMVTTASAGRCNRRGYHTLSYAGNWSHSCYSCHKTSSRSWESELVGVAKKQQEYAAMLEGLAQLGFVQQGQGAYAAGSTNAYADQGTTAYGYSQYSASTYGDVDLSAQLNQAARITTQAQELAGSSTQGLLQAINAAGNNQAEVAKIMAQGQAAAAALHAARGNPSPPVEVKQFTFSVMSDGSVDVSPMTTESHQSVTFTAQGNPAFASMLAKCGSCHGGDDPKGSLDLVGADWTPELADKVMTRVLLPDSDEKHMPPADKEQLTPLEKIAIVSWLTKPEEE